MATGGKAPSGKSRGDREARERARLYQARTAFHEGQKRRRSRDNLIVGIVGGVIVVGAIAGQFAYYGVGPGAPAPAPTPTSTPTPTSPLAPTPPPVTPEPSPSPTP